MIGSALAVDFASGWFEESKQVSGTISPIVKVLKSRLIGSCGQGGSETFKCLNARALVETVQVLQGTEIAFNDMFHFGKEICIGDLQVVFSEVGPQCMLQENSMNGCTADRLADVLRVFFEILLCVTQLPPMNTRKWGCLLAVDSNSHKPSGFGKTARSTTTLDIGEGLAFFYPTHPPTDCFLMGGGENGNAPMVNSSNAQGGDGGPLPKSSLYQGTAGRGAERLLDKWQPALHV